MPLPLPISSTYPANYNSTANSQIERNKPNKLEKNNTMSLKIKINYVFKLMKNSKKSSGRKASLS